MDTDLATLALGEAKEYSEKVNEINILSKNKMVITHTGGKGVRGTKISEEGVNFIKSFISFIFCIL